jgi:hypothetical protein
MEESWDASLRRFEPMNEHDVVRVKATVMATPWFEDDPIEIQSGWEGTIVIQVGRCDA